jgi:hypothetical protein
VGGPGFAWRRAADGAGRDDRDHRDPSAQEATAFFHGSRQWIVTAYALAFGSLLPLGGKPVICSTQVGLIAGLVGFSIASAIGGPNTVLRGARGR